MKSIRIGLRELLEKQGITRYELSKRTGIGYPVLDNYYKNRVVRYDSYLLLKICTALDCSIDQLILIEEIPEK